MEINKYGEIVRTELPVKDHRTDGLQTPFPSDLTTHVQDAFEKHRRLTFILSTCIIAFLAYPLIGWLLVHHMYAVGAHVPLSISAGAGAVIGLLAALIATPVYDFVAANKCGALDYTLALLAPAGLVCAVILAVMSLLVLFIGMMIAGAFSAALGG